MEEVVHFVNWASQAQVTPNWWIQVPIILGALAVGIPFLLQIFIKPMIREEFEKTRDMMLEHLRWEHGSGSGSERGNRKTGRDSGIRYRSDDRDETRS